MGGGAIPGYFLGWKVYLVVWGFYLTQGRPSKGCISSIRTQVIPRPLTPCQKVLFCTGGFLSTAWLNIWKISLLTDVLKRIANLKTTYLHNLDMGTIFEKFSARVRDSVHHLTYLTLWHSSGCSINSSNNGMQHVILSYNQGRVLPWLWAGSLTSFWNHFIKTNDSVIFFPT